MLFSLTCVSMVCVTPPVEVSPKEARHSFQGCGRMPNVPEVRGTVGHPCRITGAGVWRSPGGESGALLFSLTLGVADALGTARCLGLHLGRTRCPEQTSFFVSPPGQGRNLGYATPRQWLPRIRAISGGGVAAWTFQTFHFNLLAVVNSCGGIANPPRSPARAFVAPAGVRAPRGLGIPPRGPRRVASCRGASWAGPISVHAGR